MMLGDRVGPGWATRVAARARCLSVVTAILASVVAPAAAQNVAPAAYATRAALEQELRGGKGLSSDQLRLIRARLDSGDFRAGDRVLLTVEGERELSDTFTIGMGNELTLPQIGVIELRGVLRAELHGRLTQVLGRYLRDPVVHARSLIRVSVEGEVLHPGFYDVSPESPVADLLTAAGGVTREAKFENARVEREGRVILSGMPLENGVRGGSTFDAMNLRAGDRLYVPGRRNWNSAAQTLAILLTIPITIYTITQIW